MLICDLLKAAGEPPLREAVPDVLEAYRLTISSSGWVRPTIIRLDRRRIPDLDREWCKDARVVLPAELYTLTVHLAAGQKQDRLSTRRARVSEVRWRSLLVLLAASRFWELPEEGGNGGGMDDPRYSLAGYKDGQVRVRTRWGPA